MFTEPTDGDIRPLPVLIDVDTGIDDAVALALAATDQRLDLVAVTCVAGNTGLPDVVTNSRTVLELAGRSDVPVAAGAARALLRPPIGTSNAWVHGGSGRGYTELTCDLGPTFREHAAELIVRAARERPGELTLVTTGPLTNVALAVRLEPELPRLLRRWIFMGGAFAVPGNTTPYGEFNVVADPDAAAIAIDAFGAADCRPVGVGLDVTHQVRLLPEHIEELARRVGDTWSVRPDAGPWGTSSQPLLAFLEGALRKYCEYHHAFHGFYGIYVHDAVTVLAALQPELLATRAVAVQVEASSELCLGATVADWIDIWKTKPNVDVAVEINADSVLDQIVAGLGRVTGA